MSENSENTASNKKPANKSSSNLTRSSDTVVPEISAHENTQNNATAVGKHKRSKNKKKSDKTSDEAVTKPTRQSRKQNEDSKSQISDNTAAKPTRQPGKQIEKKKSLTGNDATETTRKSSRNTKQVDYYGVKDKVIKLIKF